MAINLYSKASVDSLLSPKLSISSLTNAAATTLNATAPTTDQVLSFDGTELKWATVSGGGGLTISTLSNGATSTLNATAPTTGQALTYDGTDLKWSTVGGGSVSWGGISGTISDQTDLNTALGLKAPLASPTFTGTPSLPTGTTGVTQTAGNSTTALATTAFVTTADNLKANIASPTFTGNPTAPTPATADNDTSIATTAFVKAQGYAPLASPTFTGNPTAPTPATSDNDTSISTTAFVKAQGYLTSSAAASTYVIPNGTTSIQVTGGTIRSIDGSDNFVSLDGYTLNFGNLGTGIVGLSVDGTGITFADSTVQTTAANNPDRAMADAIANIIYTQSSSSSGDICFSNVPQFISNLTTNWGIVDSSAVYEYCTGFSGSTYYLSNSVGSGPYYVRVNGIDSSFTI